MLRTITRRIAAPVAFGTLGAGFALACVYAAGPAPADTVSRDSGTPVGTTFRALTTEEIDVLAEGDDADHPWEECRINTDYAISCPDGTWHEYPVPEDDGSTTDPGARAEADDLRECVGPDDEPTNIPCRVPMTETYVVGGDGTTHDGCVIVLSNNRDSEMVCRDDTVWPS
jgi:hypothetical protein